MGRVGAARAGLGRVGSELERAPSLLDPWPVRQTLAALGHWVDSLSRDDDVDRIDELGPVFRVEEPRERLRASDRREPRPVRNLEEAVLRSLERGLLFHEVLDWIHDPGRVSRHPEFAIGIVSCDDDPRIRTHSDLPLRVQLERNHPGHIPETPE